MANQPDRSRCLINFNEQTNFTKSLMFDTVSVNGTFVQCELEFGSGGGSLRTASPTYALFFADEAFLRADPKSSMIVDYAGITDDTSFLQIDVLFEASEAVDIEWSLNGQRLALDQSLSSPAADFNAEDTTAVGKYTHACVHYSTFGVKCYLLIENYNNKDVGEYVATLRLKYTKNISIRLSSFVIKPSKTMNHTNDFCLFFILLT